MSRRQVSRVAWGLILILAGLVFFGVQVFGPPEWWDPATSWPLIIVGIGAVFAVVGGITRTAEMAVPACLVGGIGLVLYYLNATGSWINWILAAMLVPGFAGAGMVMAGLFSRRQSGKLAAGGWLIVISLILFLVFGSLLGRFGLFGAPPASIASFWPALLIVFGVFALLRSFRRRRESRQGAGQESDEMGLKQ